MRKLQMRTLILLTVSLLISLSASPFIGSSYAQNSPQQTVTPDKTPAPKPFVSHHVAADPVLYGLNQLRTAYDVQPLIDAGYDGEGQTIALVGISSFAQSDVDSFVKRNHLPKPHIETILLGTAQTKPLPSAIELTLDVEVVLAIAPKATILVYETPTAYDAFARIGTDQRAHITSVSYSVCEGLIPPLGFPVIHNLMVPPHSPRISLFVGSGDNGAFDCAEETDPTTGRPVTPSIAQELSVSVLASDPSVTAVGGTLLHMTGSHYSSEEVWNTYRLKGSSGGGVSTYWPLPAYQTAYYLSDLNPGRMRQVPDVSANADNYGLIGYGGLGTGTGTSLSTPLWAAGILLVDQYLTSKLKDSQALLVAPEMLYGLKTAYTAGRITLAPFHEITKGDNRYFLAGPRYNLATGLGTPDFYNIAQDTQQIYSELATIVDPTDADGLLVRADNYYTQGKLDLALDDYVRAIAFDPKSAHAITGKGTVYRDQGKLDLALDAFSQAIAVDPNYAPAYADLGSVFETQKKYVEALRSYHAYLALMGEKADPQVVERVRVLEVRLTPTVTQTVAP